MCLMYSLGINSHITLTTVTFVLDCTTLSIGIRVMHSMRFTCGATPADFLVANIAILFHIPASRH